MTNDEPKTTSPWDERPEPATPRVVQPTAARKGLHGRRKTILGSMVIGGIAGAAILGPISSLAASPAPTTSAPAQSGSAPTASDAAPTASDAAPTASGAAPTASGAAPTASAAAPAASGAAPTEGTEQGTEGGRGGHTEAVTDTSVVAKAIGISEADLLTALNGGQTVAQVAAAHSVSAQTVIDALVADGQSELAAEVASGSITQAQADAEKAEITQRATDQVNGSLGKGN